MKQNLLSVFLLIFLLTFADSCIFVKKKAVEESAPPITLSPKPEIEMKDDYLRSKQGDMIAFIPKDWFFVDVEEKISSDVFAVAVNPDYTLSAVYTNIRKSDRIEQTVEKEGLMGLARMCLQRHERKAGGAIKLTGNYQQLDYGLQSFVKFEFSNNGGASTSLSVVFISELGQYYEFSLVPMEISGKTLPPKDEIEKIFRSCVASIKFK